MLNEVQKEHQDDHNIPMKKRKKKNPEPLILPDPEKKTHPSQMKINGKKIRHPDSFPSLLSLSGCGNIAVVKGLE